jgi:hypothetical protein
MFVAGIRALSATPATIDWAAGPTLASAQPVGRLAWPAPPHCLGR